VREHLSHRDLYNATLNRWIDLRSYLRRNLARCLSSWSLQFATITSFDRIPSATIKDCRFTRLSPKPDVTGLHLLAGEQAGYGLARGDRVRACDPLRVTTNSLIT
jgi:hypothetical protein